MVLLLINKFVCKYVRMAAIALALPLMYGCVVNEHDHHHRKPAPPPKYKPAPPPPQAHRPAAKKPAPAPPQAYRPAAPQPKPAPPKGKPDSVRPGDHPAPPGR